MILGLITTLGLLVRLIFANQSFWLDEGASLMFARLPVDQLIELIKTDFHPPLFYLILRFWLPFANHTEWLIRLPFIILGTLTIPALYLLCKQIFGDKSKAPMIASLFLALNPLHVYYSQELRMYALATLFVVLSWYFLLKKKYWITSLFNLLSIFTFYGTVFNFISQIIYLFFTKSKNLTKNIFTLLTPSLILFLFWWPIFSLQLHNGDYLKNMLPGWQTLSGTLTLKSLALIPLKFILGRISLEPPKLYFLAGGLLVLLFIVIMAKALRNKKSSPLWYALLVPLMLGLLVSLKTPVLGYWRFLFVLPFFFALIAEGIESLPKIIFYGLVCWVSGVFLFSNIYFWTNTKFHREDWKGLTAFLNGKESQLLIAFPYKFAPLYFYSTDTLVVPMMDPEYKTIPVDKEFRTSRNLYYLDYLADLTDPDRKILKSIRTLNLKETGVYNFNNLGSLYEFQPL